MMPKEPLNTIMTFYLAKKALIFNPRKKIFEDSLSLLLRERRKTPNRNVKNELKDHQLNFNLIKCEVSLYGHFCLGKSQGC